MARLLPSSVPIERMNGGENALNDYQTSPALSVPVKSGRPTRRAV